MEVVVLTGKKHEENFRTVGIFYILIQVVVLWVHIYMHVNNTSVFKSSKRKKEKGKNFLPRF